MTTLAQPNPTDLPDAWPVAPGGRDVVLHTRVVTETGGGPDKTILMSASHLAHTNYWLAAAYMHDPDDAGFDTIRQRAQAVDCPLLSVPDRGPLDRSVLRSMLNMCKHYGVRIWHGHDYKSNLLGIMLRPFHSMKLITTVHGWVKQTRRTPLYYAADRWSLPYYHHIICVSPDLVERVSKLGVPDDRLSLIDNAIDEKMFRRMHPPERSPLREQYKTPAGRRVIGAMGRLSAEKAFNTLIRAAHTLVNRGHDIELWIAGEGEARDDLEKLIANLKMRNRVRLLGFCGDNIGFYNALDMYVLSSLREGLPNVLLEAMACEVPIVSTRVAGVPRLINEGDNGLLCDVGDTDGLTDAMHQLLSVTELRHRFIDAGRITVENRFSFTHRMEKVRRIYDDVLRA